MAAADGPVVFVSYCHDDAWVARKVAIHLGPRLPDGVAVWLDEQIRVGEAWRPEIGGAIDRSLLAVLLVSPEFIASDYIMHEEVARFAARRLPMAGILVREAPWDAVPELVVSQWAHRDVGREGPVTINSSRLAATSAEVDSALGPLCRRIAERVSDEYNAVRGAAAGSAAKTGGTAVAQVASTVDLRPSDELGELVGVPALPEQYVPRGDDLARLRDQLLGRSAAVGLTGDAAALGLQGQGGIGKTVLAAALARDRGVRARFPDGVFWVTLGESPDIARAQIDLLARLDAQATREVGGVLQGTAALRAELADRRVLLVVDDVWSAHAAAAFRVNGATGRVLYTTRDVRVLEAVRAEVGRVDTLTPTTAQQLLARAADLPVDRLPEPAGQILEETDRVALAVALIGASLRGQPAGTWATAVQQLRDSRSTWLDHPYADAFRALQVATGALTDQQRQLYITLSVYPEDVAIPVASIARVWTHLGYCDDAHVEPIVSELAARDLLTISDRRVRLHDLQRAYVLLHVGDLHLLHGEVLDAYRGACPDGSWSTLPPDEPYLWDHLFAHLRDAGRWHELARVARDLTWTLARISRDGRVALRADLAIARLSEPSDAALAWLDGTIRSVGHLVTRVGDVSSAASTLRAQIPPSIDLDVASLDAYTSVTIAPRWIPPRADSRQLEVLAGHTGGALAVAWAPDGRRLAAAGRDGIVRIWDPATGVPTADLAGHTGGLLAVAWAPDGRRLAAAGRDGIVRIWDPATGVPTAELAGHTGAVNAVAWTPDGTRLAAAGVDGIVRIWDPATRVPTAELAGHTGAVNAVAWTPDGTRLAAAGVDRIVRIWDPTTGTLAAELTGHTGGLLTVAWTRDGTRLAAAGVDGIVRIWDPTGTQTGELTGHTDWVNAVTWAPDGTRLASASCDRTVRIWDPTGTQTGELTGHTDWVNAVAWAPDGTRLASASFDWTVRIWNPVGTHNGQPAGHSGPVNTVAWAPAGTRLASAGRDATVRIWDLAGTKTGALTGHTDGVLAVTWAPDGTRLASASADGTVRIWDPTTGTPTAELTGHVGTVNAVAWAPDGSRLASAGRDGTVRIWDPTTGTPTAELTRHVGTVNAVAWAPDGGRLASAGRDGTVRIWNPAGTQTGELSGHDVGALAVAWAPDGSRLASASADGTVRIWDPAGRQPAQLTGHTGWVNAVAWAPDGTRLASASDDGTVRTWDVSNWTAATVVIGNAVRALDWRGGLLAVASDDTTMVYDIDPATNRANS